MTLWLRVWGVGVIISLVVGALSLFYGISPPWSILFSAIALLLSLLANVKITLDNLMVEVKSPFFSVTPTLSRLLREPAKHLVSLVNSATAALEYPNPRIQALAEDLIKSTSKRMLDLAQGTHVVDLAADAAYREQYAIDHASSTYWAVSVTSVENYWAKPEGQTIIDHGAAAKGRIKMKRIFLIDKGELAIMRPWIEKHHSTGVEVFWIDSSTISEELHRDIAIVDEPRTKDGSVARMAVELVFNKNQRVHKTEFWHRGSPRANQEIKNLTAVWNELSQNRAPVAFEQIPWPHIATS